MTDPLPSGAAVTITLSGRTATNAGPSPERTLSAASDSAARGPKPEMVMVPPDDVPSRMLASPMKSATKRVRGAR